MIERETALVLARDRTIRFGTLALAGLSVVLTGVAYATHVVDGYLSDDFLYLDWLGGGLGALLRRVTVDSYPRMIRPLPALAWTLSNLPAGAGSLHAFSVLLHCANAILVGRIVLRGTRSLSTAALSTSLFAVFPLLTESVIWLSGSFDLWAALFALLALNVIRREEEQSWRRDTSAAIFFGLALLSKESVLLLPLVVLLLFPAARLRRTVALLSVVAAVYLAVRLSLFGGIGGYLDPAGHSIAQSFSPLAFARAVCLQLPFRVLVPLKRADALAPALGIVSLILLGGLGVALRNRARSTANTLPLLVLVVALLPAAPLFRIEADHEGTRLLYFPVAVCFVALGLVIRPPGKVACGLAAGLVLLWSSVAIANGRSWTRAARERDHTLEALRTFEHQFPTGATVLVDVHDTLEGAYLFRNGLTPATKRTGLRQDVAWTVGTAARFGAGAARRLGADLFVVGTTRDGRPRDWTACEMALQTAPPTPMIAWPDAPATDGFVVERRGASIARVVSPLVGIARNASAFWIRFDCGRCPAGGRIAGSLFWRTSDNQPFTVTDQRAFSLDASDGAVTVRLPSMDSAPTHLQVRLDLLSGLDCCPAISIGILPPVCDSGP